jgi:hypothetical protein
MKIKDIPQVGKLGLTVTWPGRNGLIRRTLVMPANPRTAVQLAVRDILQQQARRFDALSQAQSRPGGRTWRLRAARAGPP